MRIILILTLLVSGLMSEARPKKVIITASEADAIIYANGQQVGVGTATITVAPYTQMLVSVKKVAFLTQEHTFYNGVAGQAMPPKNYHFNLQRDDAYAASSQSDKANIDFSILVNQKLNTVEVWRLTTQIATDYFDAIEVSDKETYYMRTSWEVQSFQQATIRTRLIIKLGRSNPLTFKVKLVSEFSGRAGTSIKADEQYRDWDRVLRKYEDIIDDFNTRLGNN